MEPARSGGAAANAISARRAAQLSIQRLITQVSPGGRIHPFPPLCPGLEATQAQANFAPALRLPGMVAPLVATGSMQPVCVHCSAGMTWAEWHQEATAVGVGRGLFHARCATCRANDALFKDGRPP